MTLGEMIQRERERQGLSRSELARRANVTPPVITRIETGENQPRAATISAIAKVLDVDVRKFLAVAGDRPSYNEDAAEIEEMLAQIEALVAEVRRRASFSTRTTATAQQAPVLERSAASERRPEKTTYDGADASGRRRSHTNVAVLER